jgi:hypothetical protein
MNYAQACFLAPLAALPVVITGARKYITRSGEVVEVHTASGNQDLGCKGTYPTGQAEGWHRSGRLYSSKQSMNDIVQAA